MIASSTLTGQNIHAAPVDVFEALSTYGDIPVLISMKVTGRTSTLTSDFLVRMTIDSANFTAELVTARGSDVYFQTREFLWPDATVLKVDLYSDDPLDTNVAITTTIYSSVSGGVDAASIRAAVGLASANLDSQLSGIAAGIGSAEVDNAAIASAVRTELTTELGRIDASVSSRSTFNGGVVASVTAPVTVGTNNDKTGYALTQAFPTNFPSLGINPSGHINRVTLVDTTTANTDMRGTDNALLAAGYTAPANGEISAIKAKTDNLPANPAAASDVSPTIDFNPTIEPTTLDSTERTAIAIAVRGELSTELGRIDASVSSRSTFNGGAVASVTAPVTVGSNNDKMGYALTQAFPSNFASLGINPSGHVSRVTLVDTTTANSDMRGTDGALQATSYIAPANDQISAIKAKTDNLPANPASVSDVSPTIDFNPTIEPTTLDNSERSAIATAVRTELSTELGRIDASVSSRSTFNGGAVASVTGSVGSVANPVTVGTNNDKTGYALIQAFPSNFASLGINPSGHVNRVSLVDTTTANTDMRGTDNALQSASYIAPANSDIAAIKAKTDNLPAVPASASDVSPTIDFNPTIEPTTLDSMERIEIASAVRSELANELGRIDVPVSTRSTFNGGAVASVSEPVTVGTNHDKTGYTLTQTFPSNFASLGINASGHIDRVTLVDTTTANTDMRGTNNALLAVNYTAPANGDIAAIKAKTDNLPAVPASASDVSPTIDFNPTIEPTTLDSMERAAIATAVRTELSTELGRIDVPVSTRSAFDPATMVVTVGINNDKTGYALTQAFPSNFASLGINASGHINRVSLVDTTTVNTDMRGTDGALFAVSYSAAPSAAAVADAVWDETQSDHLTEGTFGSYLDSSVSGVSTGGVSAGDIANAVRGELSTELSRIDVEVSSRSTFAGGAVASVTGAVGSVTEPVTVGTNNDKTGYELVQQFPANFASLGINPSGNISRVTLVDTTTTNSDMRGTDNALLAANYSVPANDQIAAIKAKTDNLPSDPASVSDVSPTIDFNPTIEPTTLDSLERDAIAIAVRTELATELVRIDASVSSRSTFSGGAVASVTGAVGSVTNPVTVGTNNDKTGYSLTQAFPSNFASLGINPSGHINRVSLVDTTTANTDMRGTDNALLATTYTAPANDDIAAIKAKTDNLSDEPEGVSAAAVWQYPDRTLTSGETEIVIDVEQLATEIAQALTPSGLYRLTIETRDEDLQAVPGSRMQLVGVAGTYRTIGTDGKTSIDLDPGVYTLRLTAPNGYAPVPDRELQIVDADITETITLVSFLPSIVPPPGACAFTVRVASQETSNLAGVPVSARLPKGYVVNVDTLNINLQTSQTTNSYGLATLILLRDQSYELVVRRPDSGIVTLSIRTPDAQQATLSQVIEV